MWLIQAVLRCAQVYQATHEVLSSVHARCTGSEKSGSAGRTRIVADDEDDLGGSGQLRPCGRAKVSMIASEQGQVCADSVQAGRRGVLAL